MNPRNGKASDYPKTRPTVASFARASQFQLALTNVPRYLYRARNHFQTIRRTRVTAPATAFQSATLIKRRERQVAARNLANRRDSQILSSTTVSGWRPYPQSRRTGVFLVSPMDIYDVLERCRPGGTCCHSSSFHIPPVSFLAIFPRLYSLGPTFYSLSSLPACLPACHPPERPFHPSV